MLPHHHVLILTSDSGEADQLSHWLESWGFFAIVVSPDESLNSILAREMPALGIMASPWAGLGAAEWLEQWRRVHPDACSIILSDTPDELDEVGPESGLLDVLARPIDPIRLRRNLALAADLIRARGRERRMRERIAAREREIDTIQDRLSQMARTTLGLVECRDRTELASRLLDDIAGIMDAGGGSIYMRQQDILKRLHAHGDSDAPEELPFPPPEGSVFRRCLRTRQPVLVTDISRETGIRPSGGKHYRNASLLVFPLFDDTSGEVVGFISLHDKAVPPFSTQDRLIGLILSAFSLEALHSIEATAALSKSEQSLRAVFEAANHVAFITTEGEGANPTITHFSPGAEMIFGYSREEVIGQPISVLNLTEEAARYQEDHQRQESDSLYGELLLTRRNGERFPALLTTEPVFDHAGEIFAALTVIVDVTEQRRAHHQMMRLATVVDQMAEVVMVTGTDGRIEYVNPAFEQLTGYTMAEVVGLKPSILRSGRHDHVFYRNLWETIKGGDVWQGHFINKAKNGKLFEEEATISPIRDASGHIVNYVAVQRDVTHEVALERQLRQVQKMEAIGRLAGGIAHDFNNLLTAILGYAYLAMSYAPGNRKVQQTLMEVVSAGEHAKEIIKQILTFSREADQERQPLHIELVIKEAVRLLRATLPSAVEIKTHIDPDCGMVLADPSQIHQVMMNLGTNAVQAMRRDGGGLVEVSLEAVAVDKAMRENLPELVDPAYIRLRVRDNGEGIPTSALDSIFEPFFTTKPKGEGTGMGLAIVHGIVTGHKGVINVTSAPGQGATFDIFLPQWIGREEPLITPDVSTPLGDQQHLLIVEDDDQLLRMLREIIERMGYRVTAIGGSLEALDWFDAHPEQFDLALLDNIMPGMTGLELARELHVRRPEMPIVLTTGFSESVTQSALEAAGIHELIIKPDLVGKIGQVLGRIFRAKPEENTPDA